MNQPKFKLGQAVEFTFAIQYLPGKQKHLKSCGRVEDVQSRGTEFFYRVNENCFPQSKLRELVQ